MKTNCNLAKFRENKQSSETSKLQPVNLSETSGGTAGVHQTATDPLKCF